MPCNLCIRVHKCLGFQDLSVLYRKWGSSDFVVVQIASVFVLVLAYTLALYDHQAPLSYHLVHLQLAPVHPYDAELHLKGQNCHSCTLNGANYIVKITGLLPILLATNNSAKANATMARINKANTINLSGFIVDVSIKVMTL